MVPATARTPDADPQAESILAAANRVQRINHRVRACVLITSAAGMCLMSWSMGLVGSIAPMLVLFTGLVAVASVPALLRARSARHRAVPGYAEFVRGLQDQHRRVGWLRPRIAGVVVLALLAPAAATVHKYGVLPLDPFERVYVVCMVVASVTLAAWVTAVAILMYTVRRALISVQLSEVERLRSNEPPTDAGSDGEEGRPLAN